MWKMNVKKYPLNKMILYNYLIFLLVKFIRQIIILVSRYLNT